VSSITRYCNKAGLPSQRHSRLKRVSALYSTGSCSLVVCQLTPSSVDTSTRLTLLPPDQACPVISYKQAMCRGFSGLGEVMTDLASMTQVNMRALPSAIRSVYFEVSSRVIHGLSPTFSRRSHLTFMLASQPGSTKRSG